KVYTVRRSYNGALAIIDSETIYQHNTDEQPVDHVLTVNGTGDSDDDLDLTISIGVVPAGMQFVTSVEVIYHGIYYEILAGSTMCQENFEGFHVTEIRWLNHFHAHASFLKEGA